MTIEVGALEQAYAKVESAYAASAATGGEALSATDAIRHLALSLESKKNRVASPEKRGTPDEAQSLPRRQTSLFNLSEIMWEPSGTIGTQSNIGKFLDSGMGAKHVIGSGLSTTVNSSPSPTATGCTLISATGLAVNDVAVFTVGGVLQATRIKTIASLAVTYDALSAAPDNPGAAYAGVTYQLANTVSQSLSIYKYYNAGNFKQAVYGAVIDEIEINFDGTAEVVLSFQGPAGRYSDSSTGGGTTQAKPGSFTTVGAPASGLVGSFYVDGNAFLVTSAKFKVANNLELRNSELGTAWASGIAGRTNLRKITVEVTFYLEDTRLLGMANSVTKGVLRCLVGSAAGSMVAAVAPSVEFEIPSVGNEIGPKQVTITGTCYATSGNDALFLGEL